MSTNSKERRRRIAERGSDRLALITGRIDNLPVSSRSYSDLPPSVVSENEGKHFSSYSEDFSNNTLQLDKYAGQTGIKQDTLPSDSSSQESTPSALDTDEKIKQSPVSSKNEGSLSSTSNVRLLPENSEPVVRHHYNGISPKQISVAVAASEMIRIYISVAAAILVFLSYIGFPILGSSIIKSIILSRPLCLLLVTNISVVLVPLLLDNNLVNSSAEVSGASPLGTFEFGKALEIGLMLQQCFGGLFMDCSVYSVVVVCLLSLAQKLGW
ncbi:RNA-binding (RRM/RBD/RNP motifs) family protein [Heracleum sosnowskyi]|uniref:RNA-binding (RRM/RBD/RNP motifs) family protein n=1 Tax=Heracleum sosnowskyi TaxID=360622 RepID=A0AAD8MDY6_9APIA|nr:RNA-binding (RRM/RBD/RNP motifs) family protein [Heracleum sosnowskyi]